MWAKNSFMQKLAEQEGIAPNADDLSDYFIAWQKREVVGENMTYGDKLIEARGTDNAVDAASVREFLAIRIAAIAYRDRNISQPVPPKVLEEPSPQP